MKKHLLHLRALKSSNEKKKTNLTTTHLIAYQGTISQLLAQGMNIEENLHALLIMRTLPRSRITPTTLIYGEGASAVLSEEDRRNSFLHDLVGEVNILQTMIDRQNIERHSSS